MAKKARHNMGGRPVRLACVLLVCGLTTGCVYVPLADRSPARLVGDDPRAALRVGTATRDAVVAQLGQPTTRTADDRTFVYSYHTDAGAYYGFIPQICGAKWGSDTIYDVDTLTLQFNDAGTLIRSTRTRDRQ